jgi:serine/threonine protein kinase
MASVWLADDARLRRQVAVKVMADTLAGDDRYRRRFAREARAAASVSHPSLVPVYDYGSQGARPFLVMEYVAGGSLADVLSGAQPLPGSPAALAGELLGGLDCVHRAGLVHRDVKPANIMLDADGRARLTDFGIAQPHDATALTQTGMVIGSLRYLAPEVAAGARATPAADLYAAGVVLREVAGHQPAPELTPLVAALTQARPDDRPNSAAAALALLATPATGPTEPRTPAAVTRVAPAVAPPPAAAPGRRQVTSRRTPPPAALALAAVLVLVAGIVVLVAVSGRGSPAATKTPAPAAASAPLDAQLRSLEALVTHAAKP